MAEEIIGTLLIVAIVIAAITVVFVLGKPLIEKATITGKITEAESSMRIIQNNIEEVVDEGVGSSRLFRVKFPGEATVLENENAVQFPIKSGTEVFDFLSRTIVTGNIMRISESSVTCTEAENMIMENNYIRVELQKVRKNQPLSDIDTKNNIVSITFKETGDTIYPSDSSTRIDGYEETSAGVGYSELLAEGQQPVCTAHFFVDSIYNYDIYYKLYSGADFLVVEVANIIA